MSGPACEAAAAGWQVTAERQVTTSPAGRPANILTGHRLQLQGKNGTIRIFSLSLSLSSYVFFNYSSQKYLILLMLKSTV